MNARVRILYIRIRLDDSRLESSHVKIRVHRLERGSSLHPIRLHRHMAAGLGAPDLRELIGEVASLHRIGANLDLSDG